MGTIALIRWLLACFALAVLTKPVFCFRELRFADGGFSTGLGLGTAVSFLTVFWVCVLTGCPFNSFSCVTGLIATALIFGAIRVKKGYAKAEVRWAEKASHGKERRRFFAGFCVFTLLFLTAVWIKGFKPYIDFQTEQYMDYGFMTAMYRQQTLPFEDIWSAGLKVNYYYLGQAAAVFFCRISGVTPEYGYNLMLCTLFSALVMTVYTLTEAFLRSIKGMSRAGAYTGGAAASLMCACGGNGHWIIYGIFKQLYYRINGIIPEKEYWFPTSTLFIGYEPDIADKAKHEFPAYTLILGDLHAHVCNMMFTIPLLAVLFDYALCGDERDAGSRKPAVLNRIFSPHMVMTGLLLGLFKGINYWDFAIYFVVAGAVILFADFNREGIKLSTLVNVLLKGVVVFAVSSVVILPFSMNYIKPVEGVHFADNHSPAYKLAIIWFAHVIMSVTLVVYILIKHPYRQVSGREKHTPVMLAAALCGLGLLLLPEIVYVKDIYGDAYQRYNTMFKLTFQGFILLSISSGMCTGILLDRGLAAFKEGRKGGLLPILSSGVFCILAVMLSAYMGWSVKAWFGNIFRAEDREGISSVSFIEDDPLYDNVREAIGILNSDKSSRLHIIEEAGTSYSPESKVSVFTGASAVLGWYVHEWVWRNDFSAVYDRQRENENFYTCGYEDYCRALLKKYDVDYIYVGPQTLKKYRVDYSGFTALGEHVWESGDGRYMLIKVNKQ